MVSLECATWELTNLLQFITSVYCARWMSQLQGFGFPKLLTRKRRLLSILFRNLRFTRTNGRYRFFENQWTFGYCIQISKDLDTISKSLKIFIQFFIGYPNTCTLCGWYTSSDLQLTYELLMSLRILFQNETWFGICSRRLHFMIHKKCDIANFTLGFSFKQNNYDKRNKSHISFICFRNVVSQSPRCVNMQTIKNNENE